MAFDGTKTKLANKREARHGVPSNAIHPPSLFAPVNAGVSMCAKGWDLFCAATLAIIKGGFEKGCCAPSL